MKNLLILSTFLFAGLFACTDQDPVLEEASPSTEFATLNDADDQSARLGEEVVLKVGESALYVPSYTTVTFLRILEDSRCPEGVSCIWEGRAIALFAVEERDSYLEVKLATENSQGDPPTSATVFGKTLELKKIAPYPSSREPEIPADAYRASIILHDRVIDGTSK